MLGNTEMKLIKTRLLSRMTLLCAVASMGACATVVRGTSQDWAVITDPSGAAVQTSNGFQCAATPCTFHMSRNSRFTATIAKPGYRTITAQIDHRFSQGGAAGAAGNVLAGGPIGLGVDVLSGASQDIRPNPLTLRMQPGVGSTNLSWQEAETASNSGGTIFGGQNTGAPPR